MIDEIEYCDCGRKSVWVYMPGGDYNHHYCDNCVPRGCSCNVEYLSEEYPTDPPTPEPDGTWKWVEDGVCWEYIDDKGRSYPCCEYDYYGEDQ